jgi:hypothetical protein
VIKVKKLVTVEKEATLGKDEVLVTNNGYQWTMVHRGSRKECDIIKNAYVKIGYTEVIRTLEKITK